MAGYSEYLCLAIRYQDIEQLLAESLLASVHQEEPARKRVASLDLCGNMISDLAGLDAYTYLLSLSLSHNRIDSLIAAHFPFTLTHLDISHNRLTSLEGLQGLPYLSWLDASHNEIASIGEVAQCYRLRTLLLGHNRIRSVFGIEGLLELERVQLHGNAISGSSELRLIATLQKVKHLTLRGNPVGAKPYLRLEVTHLMPSLVSLDGQPVRSGPGTPRGGSEKLARSQRQQQAQSDRPSDPYARFEAVFKAPLFDPPGGPPGTADEADPTLDVDYAPDEAVEWLHTIVGDVARTFDLDVVDMDRHGSDQSLHRSLVVEATALGTSGESPVGATPASPALLSPSRKGLHGYLVPGSPEHRVAVAERERVERGGRSLWSPSPPPSPAPQSPGALRTEESVGRHIARMQVAREKEDESTGEGVEERERKKEDESTVTKSLRHWSFTTPADSSTLLKNHLRDISPHVSTTWDRLPARSPHAPPDRHAHSASAHVERLRRAAERGQEEAERGMRLPGFDSRAPGTVMSPRRGASPARLERHLERMRTAAARDEAEGKPLPGFERKRLGTILRAEAQSPTRRDAASAELHAARVAYAGMLAEEERRGLPLPGYRAPQHLAESRAESALGERLEGWRSGETGREVLHPNSIAERLEKRLSGNPASVRSSSLASAKHSPPTRPPEASRLASSTSAPPPADASSVGPAASNFEFPAPRPDGGGEGRGEGDEEGRGEGTAGYVWGGRHGRAFGSETGVADGTGPEGKGGEGDVRGDKGAEEANGYGGSMENFVDALQRTISAQKSRSSSTLGAGHGDAQGGMTAALAKILRG